MAGLLEKIGRGVGQTLQQIGQMGFEERKAARLQALRDKAAAGKAEADAAAKAEERAFKTQEREAAEVFKRSEREAGEAFKRTEREAKAAADTKTGKSGGKPVVTNTDFGLYFTHPDGRVEFLEHGSNERVEIGKPGEGGGVTPTLTAEADAYANRRVDEMAGYLSSDDEDFKDYGGSREKARQAFKLEYLDMKKRGATPSAGMQPAPPATPAAAAPQPAAPGASANQQELTRLMDLIRGDNPNATDEQLRSAILADPRFAHLAN